MSERPGRKPTPMLVVYAIRHKTHRSLHGNGDWGEHAPFFSSWELAEAERKEGLSDPDDFEIVLLGEL